MTSVPLKMILPRWTKRVATEGGRDPLGLSRVAFMITDYLLSGIVTTTDRARYYSFYTWVLWHIANEEKPDNFQEFVNAFRRREAAMALATLAADESSSPTGVDATRKYFATGMGTGLFDCNFQVLPSNRLGGYGQYYAGSLYKLRLMEGSESGVDRPTPGTAEQLAQSFHTSVAGTPYIKKHLFLETEISQNDLNRSSESLSLDALEESFTSDERNLLTQILFGLTEEHKDKEDTIIRRQSLTLLLDIITKFEETGYFAIAKSADHGFYTDEYLLYPTYYGCLWPSDDQIFPYAPPKSLTVCNNLWRQLCLHEFFCQAIEDYLCAVLEAAGSSNEGLPLGSVAEHLINEDFQSLLLSVTRKSAKSPSALLAGLGIAHVPTEEFSLAYQQKLSPKQRASEARIVGLKAVTAAEQAARATLMLAVLYGKWRGITKDSAFRYVAHKANEELWTGRVVNGMDRWLELGLTWEAALEPMLQELVINQHQRVFYEKGNLRSVWLKPADGRIFKEQDYQPVWRNSRLFNCVRIMADLKLVNIDEQRAVSITAAGTRLLKKLLREES
jgi:hypothetical protein